MIYCHCCGESVWRREERYVDLLPFGGEGLVRGGSLYVLLIEHKGEMAYQVGLGKAFKEALSNSCLPGREWKEIMVARDWDDRRRKAFIHFISGAEATI